LSTDSQEPEDDGNGSGLNANETYIEMPIEEELKSSYLTYAMSVIVSRALPDVRDGLKPSQRRILVAMNDLNLTPGSSRVKCAKISGDTSGNYHPHGESIVYPTLVRMAQEWNMRHVLVDKQGNFGSIAGLPPAAMRYTEARMSAVAALLLEDLKLDTVDFTPTYDERRMEPSVLPSKFPNLLVNGSSGIAVSMATSIPPHNLGEVCDALQLVIANHECSISEIMTVLPGPDFPTGGIICGVSGILKSYRTGRSTIVVRSQCDIVGVPGKKNRFKIVVSELPFQQTRDGVVEKIARLVKDEKVKGISGIKDLSDLKEPVKLEIEIKSDADADVVLNQLYKFSPLQTSFSMNFMALVDGKPRELSIKDFLTEFLRHRVQVIRRRTQFLLSRARRQKHTIEGLLLALADIDQIIKTIRSSKTQAEAKSGLMGIECPSSMMQRALGDDGFKVFQEERGEASVYHLTGVQADAILKMTLGQLVNLEQEKLGGQHAKLLEEILEYLRILSDDANVNQIISDDLTEIKRRHADERRTVLSLEEVREIFDEDLIEEENMVVSISHRGYIKRTPVSTYRAQRRGGKGIKGAKSEDEDPIEHVFAASTHDYLLFFTTKGIVHWRKVHKLPQLSRESRGRAIVNVLSLSDNESVASCQAIQEEEFKLEDHFLVMVTKSGLVKKTPLSAYSRPREGGIIAIKLRDDDEIIDVLVTKTGDELVLSTANGMAIRFRESDARPMGRNTSGVKGISLTAGDHVVGMVVADPEATLLTVCDKGYGKRTAFGPNSGDGDAASEEEDAGSSGSRYRTQNRGGKGLRDIKTTDRNGKVIGIKAVNEEDELLLMTSRGKIQRIKCADVSTIGRNTQGVRIMGLDDDDSLAVIARVPRGEVDEDEGQAKPTPTEGDAGAVVPASDSSATPETPAVETDDSTNKSDSNESDSNESDSNESDSNESDSNESASDGESGFGDE
jgi:DNA gyrase subunit A